MKENVKRALAAAHKAIEDKKIDGLSPTRYRWMLAVQQSGKEPDHKALVKAFNLSKSASTTLQNTLTKLGYVQVKPVFKILKRVDESKAHLLGPIPEQRRVSKKDARQEAQKQEAVSDYVAHEREQALIWALTEARRVAHNAKEVVEALLEANAPFARYGARIPQREPGNRPPLLMAKDHVLNEHFRNAYEAQTKAKALLAEQEQHPANSNERDPKIDADTMPSLPS